MSSTEIRAGQIKAGDTLTHPVTGQRIIVTSVRRTRGVRSWPGRLRAVLRWRQGPDGTDITAASTVMRHLDGPAAR